MANSKLSLTPLSIMTKSFSDVVTKVVVVLVEVEVDSESITNLCLSKVIYFH